MAGTCLSVTSWQASDQVLAYLASYRPEQLARAAWVVAREQVVAAVLSGQLRTVQSAKQLTTSLVAFLGYAAV